MNINPKCILNETIIKITGAYAPATIRAYQADFVSFIDYCSERSISALPADSMDIAQYINHLPSKAFSSAYIRRILAAISTIHKLNYYPDPTSHPEVRLAMRRMHRQLGRYAQQANPITHDLLEKLLGQTNSTLRGKRDRALLMVAYDTLCRRSELTSLRIEDIHIKNSSSFSILLRKSKTDQDAQGKWLYISEYTYDALYAWITAAKIDSGFIFRAIKKGGHVSDNLGSGQVSRIFKYLSKRAGVDKEIIKHISGHSMRVGAAQDLMLAGASLPIIMARGRWSKIDTVMRYVESASYRTI